MLQYAVFFYILLDFSTVVYWQYCSLNSQEWINLLSKRSISVFRTFCQKKPGISPLFPIAASLSIGNMWHSAIKNCHIFLSVYNAIDR